jgi:dUTP pyrophosphatase
MSSFQVQRLSPEARLPTRGSAQAAGWDLAAAEPTIVPAGGRALVATHLAIRVPADCYGRVAPRSGLALRYGIQVGAGVVDSDYTGEVKVLLFNHGTDDFGIATGDRVAQFIVEKIHTGVFEEVQVLGESERGAGGFGSTGV